jgi:hypothetical protein
MRGALRSTVATLKESYFVVNALEFNQSIDVDLLTCLGRLRFESAIPRHCASYFLPVALFDWHVVGDLPVARHCC